MSDDTTDAVAEAPSCRCGHPEHEHAWFNGTSGLTRIASCGHKERDETKDGDVYVGWMYCMCAQYLPDLKARIDDLEAKLAAANAMIDDLAGDSNDADDLRDKLAAVTRERDRANDIIAAIDASQVRQTGDVTGRDG